MAYDISISGFYSGRPAYNLYLYVRRDQTDVGNNRSSYAWELQARNPSGSSATFALDCFPWGVNVGGYYFSGCHNMDFRGGQSHLVFGVNSTGWIGHDGNGYLTIVVDAWHGPASVFGTADPPSAWFSTDRIARPPGATCCFEVTEATINSLRYKFEGTSNGGSNIAEWEVQASPTANFSSGVITYYNSAGNGVRVFTGLNPATTYYFRSRGRNGVGWGPYGSVVSGATLPATPPGMTVAPSLSGTQAVVTLTPPSGSTGVTSYEVEYRPVGGAATPVSGSSPITVTNLTPGTSYEWRARAIFGSAPSPWTDWATYYQPNPNTNPGQYFDGSTADTADVNFVWAGTVNNSESRALGMSATGWADFAQASEVSGGTGAQYRATGAIARYPEGQPAGAFSARYVFFGDANVAGFRAGTDPVIGGSEVSEGGTYIGSIFAQPSRSQRLAAGISWYDSLGNLVSRSLGLAQIVPSTSPVRLSVTAICPEDGVATVEAVDVAGDGWSLWLGGEGIVVDGAMVTVGAPSPYFDGNTPDTSQYDYAWLDGENSSPSTRTTLDAAEDDPLADPDCPAPPSPPSPPVIEDDCILDVGVWRRYWVQVTQSEVAEWLATIPTLTLSTGTQAARQVRVRYYVNPDNLPPGEFTPSEWVAEQIVRYMPPETVLTLDGVSERARASVNGADWIAADHLLYGTGGAPATWPLLSCGTGYLISLDVPLDAGLGNLTTDLALTRRML